MPSDDVGVPRCRGMPGWGVPDWSPTPLIRASLLLHGAAAVALPASPGLWPLLLGGLAANHAVLAGFALSPCSQAVGRTIGRLPDDAQGVVALTFDDGPDPAVTPTVLDMLERAGAGASFFCIGRHAAAHPALVREIIARGHTVENHSQDHPVLFAGYGLGALERQIATAQAVLAECGAEPRFFRAPMGLRSPLLDPVLARLGLRHVSWTRRGLDGVDARANAVLRRLTDGLTAGDILLLHDGKCAYSASGRPVVLDVLPRLLATLAERNLRAVSLVSAPATAAAARSSSGGCASR